LKDRSARAVIEDGEEEVGGFVKTRRTRLPLEEKPGKNKTPRRREVLLPSLDQVIVSGETQQAPVVVLPAVSAVKPPEKKIEGEEMKTATATAAPTTARLEYEICPICGFFSKSAPRPGDNGEKIRYLVCKGCNDKYTVYAKKVAEEIVAGKKPAVLSKVEWVLSQIDIERFEKELEVAKKTRVNVEARVSEMIRVAVDGKALPREVFTELRAKYHQEVSREDYFLVKRLFARLEAAKKLKLELEQMLAVKAAPVALVPVVS